MVKHHRLIRAFFLLALAMFVTGGCGTAKTLVRKITPGKAELRKRVMVLPFLDRAGLGPERTAELGAEFRGRLERSDRLVVHEAPPGLGWPQGDRSPDLGILPQEDFVRVAEDRAMNALVFAVINPIEVRTERRGIWPLRKQRRVYEFSLVVNVVDLGTRTLLYSQIESEEVSRVVKEIPRGTKETRPDSELRKEIANILKRQAGGAAESLARAPWTGRLLSVEGETLTLSAGEQLGVRPGDRFLVFGREDLPQVRGGQAVRLLGPQIGLIEVNAVSAETATAIAVEKGAFTAEQFIRPAP